MPPYRKILMVLPVAILAAATLYIGLNAESIAQIAERIADELIDTRGYVEAVLRNGKSR